VLFITSSWRNQSFLTLASLISWEHWPLHKMSITSCLVLVSILQCNATAVHCVVVRCLLIGTRVFFIEVRDTCRKQFCLFWLYPELWISRYPAHGYRAVSSPGFEPTTFGWESDVLTIRPRRSYCCSAKISYGILCSAWIKAMINYFQMLLGV
jgi:hypothetical protein